MKTLDIRHQIELVPDHDRIDPDRLRQHEADFTPRSVVRQGLRAIGEHFGLRPDKMLDPSAGAGVFGMEARSLWPSCRVLGIEPRDEEDEHLARNCHEYAIRRFDDVCIECPFVRDWAPFDLVASNIPFSQLREFIELALKVTRRFGIVAFVGLNEWGTRGEDSRRTWERFPPWLQLRIGGTLKFRNGLNPDTGKPWGVDMRSYSWWCWRADGKGGAISSPQDGWRTRDLPLLAPDQRKWRVRPGTGRTL